VEKHVVTLIYLARQIRHSTQATRIAAYHQAQEQMWSVAEAFATDSILSDILSRTLAGGLDDLDMPERIRMEFALGSLYFGFESLLSLHEKGHIDPELWDNVLENNFRLWGSPLGREFLASRRGPVSRRLEALVSERLDRKSSDR
jgi:hypothetical protein